MSTLAELISGVRLTLDYPLPGVLTDEKILDKLSDVSQLLLLEAQNTGISWCVDKFDLQVNLGQPDLGYIIPAPNFAKDIMVRTVDPSDPFHVSREVMRCDPQDVDQYYRGPETNLGGPQHSAVVCTVTRVGPTAYIQFFPSPSQPAIYRIWYETGFFSAQDLSSEPFLPPFHAYLKVRTAATLLPKCRWQGFSKDENAEYRQELALSLAPDIQEFTHAFKVWITSDRIESVSKRVGFGDYYERSDFDYWIGPGPTASSSSPTPTPPPETGDALSLDDGLTLLTLDDGVTGLGLA